jgi:hypothetical protein
MATRRRVWDLRFKSRNRQATRGSGKSATGLPERQADEPADWPARFNERAALRGRVSNALSVCRRSTSNRAGRLEPPPN